MNKEFLDRNLSIELKEIGFDEPCIAYYRDTDTPRSIDQKWGMSVKGISESLGYHAKDLILAPLYQQVFDWFREKHELYHYVEPKLCWPDNFVSGVEFYCQVIDKNGNHFRDTDVMDYKESEIACIKTMIQVVKNSIHERKINL